VRTSADAPHALSLTLGIEFGRCVMSGLEVGEHVVIAVERPVCADFAGTLVHHKRAHHTTDTHSSGGMPLNMYMRRAQQAKPTHRGLWPNLGFGGRSPQAALSRHAPPDPGRIMIGGLQAQNPACIGDC
jgi:hypothetical protein